MQTKSLYRGKEQLLHLLGIVDKGLQSLIGKRMIQKSHNSLQRACGNIGTGIEALNNMHCMPYRGSKHLCPVTITLKYVNNVRDKFHTIGRDIIEPPDKRRNISSTSFGSK